MQRRVLFVFASLGCLALLIPAAHAQDAASGDAAAESDTTTDSGTATDSTAPADDGAADAPSTSDAGGATSSGAGSSSGSSGASPMVINVNTADDDEDEEEEEEPPPQSPIDPHENPGESYHHIGVFARGLFVPQAIQQLFVDGGRDSLNVGSGLFYNYRRDGLNIIAEVWWSGFHTQSTYHGLNESDFEREWIESELNVVFANIVLMWSIPIADWLAFEIGFGVGFGGVYGGLYRTEARPDGSGGFTPCDGPGTPDPTYCDAPDASYGDGSRPQGEGSYDRYYRTSQPYNFSGGVPPLFFWVDLPRVAIRIKPMRQIQIRVEGGYAAYAIYFGGSLAFGF